MGTLLQFAPRKETKTLPSQNEMSIGSTVTQLVTKTLPEVLYDAYSPDVTSTTILHVEKAGFEILLNAAVVGHIEGGIYHLAIRTDLDPESVSAFPEVFRDPRRVPLHLLAVEYLIGTLNDRNIVYSRDSQVQLMRYHDGVMYIIELPTENFIPSSWTKYMHTRQGIPQGIMIELRCNYSIKTVSYHSGDKIIPPMKEGFYLLFQFIKLLLDL